MNVAGAWATATKLAAADAYTTPVAKLSAGAAHAAAAADLTVEAGAWTNERALVAELAAAAHERAAAAAELATQAHNRKAAEAWAERVLKPQALSYDRTRAKISAKQLKAADELKAAAAWTDVAAKEWKAAAEAEVKAADAWATTAMLSAAAAAAERSSRGDTTETWTIIHDRSVAERAVAYDWTGATSLWGEVVNRTAVGPGTTDFKANETATRRYNMASERATRWGQATGLAPDTYEPPAGPGTSGRGVGGPPGFP